VVIGKRGKGTYEVINLKTAKIRAETRDSMRRDETDTTNKGGYSHTLKGNWFWG